MKARGYTGSIGPVYRYLSKIDEDIKDHISSKATVRHESPPGDQAQFAWSPYNVPVDGVITTVYCFSMILSASRKKAVCFSLKADAVAIYEAIQELFEDLGGVTLELLIDNPAALVIENNPRNEMEICYKPHALLMARHLGTELNACPCYWPRKKGKIERSFNYIEEQFIKGNHFTSIEEENTLRETSPIAIEERFYKTYNFNEDGSKLLNQIERETFTYLLDYDMDKELDFYKTKCDGVEEYGYINCKVSLKDKVITITKELDLTSDKVSDELKNKTLAIIKNDYFEDEVYKCN